MRIGVKRRIAFILAVLLALCMALPASAASVGDFTDVPASAWYRDAVAFVADRGLFSGTSATTFSPKKTMDRGMFITVLGRFAGVDPDAWKTATITAMANLRSGPGTQYAAQTVLTAGSTVYLTGVSGSWFRVNAGGRTGYVHGDYVQPRYHRFTDVDYASYYAGYAIWGYEAGIVDGMGSAATYAPGREVTREQICKLLYGYAEYAGLPLADSGESVEFTDQSSISGWARAGVDAMQRAGVVMGEAVGDGYRFRPKDSATRAEAAAIFQRFSAAVTPSTPDPTEPPAETSEPEITPAPTETPGGSEEPLYDDFPGDYSYGTIYGPYLDEQHRREIKEQVRYFLLNYYDPAASDYANVKAAHDYLVDTVVYEDNTSTNFAWTAWGALVHKGATCEGYTRAFLAMCDAMGIGCYYVHSTRTQHVWNIVQVDGEWYHIDVQGNDLSNHNYWFLVSDDIMRIDGYSWDTASFPACPRTYGK